jgi:hypothetical protein
MSSKYTHSTKSIGYRIIKKDESSDTQDSSSSSEGYSSDGYSSEGGSKYKYTSIIESNYKKPKYGSKQDNFTKEQIKQKLKGYKALRTDKEKQILLTLKPFKVWIRYFNTITKEFRVGGLLKTIDPELRYIMLVNTSNNLTWSVQLKDCIIFIPKLTQDPERKQREEQEQKEQKDKETKTKEKLYKLYKEGKLGKR